MSTTTTTVPSGFQILPLSALFPSPMNPRKHFDDAKLAKLAESAKKVGIIEPLVVRPNGAAGQYEIIAGERRFRAATLAGLADVPVMVKHLGEAEAREIQIIENLQREDVHPMDEGLGYNELLGMKDPATGKPVYTVQSIAERLDMSIEYVYGRMKLAGLTPEVQEAFWANQITAGHAILIARLQPKDQALALKYCQPPEWNPDRRTSVRDLTEYIRNEMQTPLKRACFDTTSTALVPAAGACTTCPKRTGNAPDFAAGQADPEVCTDADCFEAKSRAHLHQVRLSLNARGAEHVEVSSSYTGAKKGALRPDRWEKAKKGETSKPALVVDGPDRGQVIDVVVKPERKPAPVPDYAAEQRKREEFQAREHGIRMGILQEVGKQVTALTNADITVLLEAWLDRNYKGTTDLCKLHGIDPGKDSRERLFEQVPKMQTREFARLVMEAAIVSELHPYSAKEIPDRLLAAAKRYKVDAGKIRSTVEQAAKLQTSTKSKAKAKPKKAAKAGLQTSTKSKTKPKTAAAAGKR